MALWGADALQNRTEWHFAFDLHVMRRFWKRQHDEIEEQRRNAGLPPGDHHIRGARGTGLDLPDPIPAE